MNTFDYRLALGALFRPAVTFQEIKTAATAKNTGTNLLFLVAACSLALWGIVGFIPENSGWPTAGAIGFFLFSALFLFFGYKYAFTWIFWMSSRLFRGKITLKQTRLVVALALLPSLIYPVLFAAKLIAAIYLNNPELLYFSNKFTLIVVSLVSFRIAIPGLATFNNFGYGYALLVLILPVAALQLLYLLF